MYTDRSLMGALKEGFTGTGYFGDTLDMQKTWDEFFANGKPMFLRVASMALPSGGGSATFTLRTSDTVDSDGDLNGSISDIIRLPSVSRANFSAGAEYTACLPYCSWVDNMYKRYIQLYANVAGGNFVGAQVTWGLLLDQPQVWRAYGAASPRLI